MDRLGPVEYASMDRPRPLTADLDFACGPCGMGWTAECVQGCRGHVRGAFGCPVCAATTTRSAPRLTVEQARRDLERRYVPGWMYTWPALRR